MAWLYDQSYSRRRLTAWQTFGEPAARLLYDARCDLHEHTYVRTLHSHGMHLLEHSRSSVDIEDFCLYRFLTLDQHCAGFLNCNQTRGATKALKGRRSRLPNILTYPQLTIEGCYSISGLPLRFLSPEYPCCIHSPVLPTFPPKYFSLPRSSLNLSLTAITRSFGVRLTVAPLPFNLALSLFTFRVSIYTILSCII